MRENRVINSLSTVLSLLIVIGVFTFAHICGDMGGMAAPCHTTRSFAVVLASLTAVISLFFFFPVDKRITSVFVIARPILAFLIVLLPDVIAPVCKMHTMHCYVYTRPLLVIAGSILTALALYGLVSYIWKEREIKRGQEHEALL